MSGKFGKEDGLGDPEIWPNKKWWNQLLIDEGIAVQIERYNTYY